MKTSEIERLRDAAGGGDYPGDLLCRLRAALDEYLEARRVLREEHEATMVVIEILRSEPEPNQEKPFRAWDYQKAGAEAIEYNKRRARYDLAARIAAEDKS